MLFGIVNGVITFDYALIAVYFGYKLVEVTRLKGRNPLSIITLVAAIIFLLGNAQTHFMLTLWSVEGELLDHWYEPWNVVLHIIQAVAGLVFTALSYKALIVRIYDKKHYTTAVERAQQQVDAPPRP